MNHFPVLLLITVAAWMHPLQYDLRSSAAKDNSITHAAAAPSNLDAASHYNAICKDWVAKHKRTMRNGVGNCSSKTGSRRQSDKKTILKHILFIFLKGKLQHSCSHYNAFCSMTWLTRMHLRTWQHQITTIMQPFQCDLQPQIQETNRTTHTGTTTRCRTQRRNRLNSKRSKPQPPHTRGTFHRRMKPLYTEKSAHTALAVKACLLGGNSNTKCSMTFVNIAVAISALAGGVGQKRFRTEIWPQKRFRTETSLWWCFRLFSRIFGCLSARGYWNGILGHFGSFPAMEKRQKMKKTLYIARFCQNTL